MKKNDISIVGIELAKTIGGVMAGRYAVVMGRKVLKVDEEADPKKKKLKQVGLGLGVAAIGAVGAMKAPSEYASVCAGVATAGALTAMTPFAKEEDKGFIPALHGSIGLAELEEENEGFEEEQDEMNELNALSAIDEYYDEDEELEEEDDFNSDLYPHHIDLGPVTRPAPTGVHGIEEDNILDAEIN